MLFKRIEIDFCNSYPRLLLVTETKCDSDKSPLEFLVRCFVPSRTVRMMKFCLIFTPGQSVLRTKLDQWHSEMKTQLIAKKWLLHRRHLLFSQTEPLSGSKFKLQQLRIRNGFLHISFLNFVFSFSTNRRGTYYTSSADCGGIFDCGSKIAKVMVQKRSNQFKT